MDSNEQPAPSPPASTPDAPDQETMAQIRQRRLAKLGGPSRSSTPAAASPGTETSPSVPTSTTPQPDTTTPSQPTPAENRARINITSATSSTPKPLSRPGSTPAITNNNNSATSRGKRQASDTAGSPASAPPKKQTTATATPESIEDYADRVLTAIFRVTVDPNRTTDGQGHNLTFLPNLSAEMAAEAEEEGQAQQQKQRQRDEGQQGLGRGLKLSIGRLDEAIVEAATGVPHERPLFEYLLPCWKRVVRISKLFRGPAPEKEALLKEARRLCFSNCIFALTVPELFR